MKAERDNRGCRRSVRRLIVISVGWLALVSIASAQTPAPATPNLRARISDSGHLRGGWREVDPYQYREYKRGIPILTGFDVEIERALARIMNVEILLPEIAWEDHLAALVSRRAATTRTSQKRIEPKQMF